MYEVSVYDVAIGERVHIVESMDSTQWLENWQKPGEAKLVCGKTSDNMKYLVNGNLLFVYGMTNTVAEIQGKVFEQKDDGNFKMTVHAPLCLERLDDRVVMGTENVTNFEAGMRNIYLNNRRNLSIEMGVSQGFPDTTIKSQVTYGTVLEAEQQYAERAGFGIRVVFDPDTVTKTFEIYKGVDRTLNDANNNGTYSDEMQNIVKFKYEEKSKGYKNVAVVAGQGVGGDRFIVIVSLGNVQGDNRREMFVDARDLSQEYDIVTDTGTVDEYGNPIVETSKATYTDIEYTAILQERGLQKLFEQLPEIIVSIEMDTQTVVYGRDFSLGDIIPIKIETLNNMIFKARVSSVRFIDEKDGFEVRVGLSDFQIEANTRLQEG